MENNDSTNFLTVSSLNQAVVQAQYAVRGAIVDRSQQIVKELESGDNRYPFKEIQECNIGNPQVLGQPPITFNRQVLSSILTPELTKTNVFPEGVRKRAEFYLSHIKGNIGAYSQSPGYKFVRDNVAKFLEKRDGIKADPEKILLTDGASVGISMTITALIADNTCGIMVPVPQYPLYSAQITLCHGQLVPYYLDEESGWQVTVEDLTKAYDEATKKGVKVRGITVINPGNPTGQVLDEESIKKIVEFAQKHHLVILADEVYQQNIWSEKKKFVSFKKVVSNMDSPYNKTPLLSFHSCSKGFLGECGIRGAFMEMHNIPADVEAQFKKYRTISLCSNTVGQIMVDLMVNPPTEEENGKEVYEQYLKEREDILASLKRKATVATKILNSMKNVSSKEVEGALYCFPSVKLSQKAIAEAEKKGMAPDLFFCMEALNQTGIVTVQGSGFGQREGTFHFRTTLLIRPDETFEEKMKEFKQFNDAFHEKYA